MAKKMTREEIIERIEEFLPWADEYEVNIEMLEGALELLKQESKTWSLDDAREDFVSDVYNTLDVLPTNNEANRIIESFDRVTSGIKQEPCEDCKSLPPVTPKGVTITDFEWIGEKAYPICPKCNCNIIEEYISCADYAEMYKPMKFCPNCGVKMGRSNNEHR